MALLGLVTLLQVVLGSCPYAQQMARDTSNLPLGHPHVHSARSSDSDAITAPEGKKGVFLMNRIAPGSSQLYIANADGTGERPLLSNPVFEYHAEFSPDGQWISFTSERNGDGNSDIYRVRTDGSDLQELVATSSIEDSVVLSPNGKFAAYVSTTNGYKANIWVLDIQSGKKWNVTNTPLTPAANESLPNGYFRPSWSPDGQWLAFSSDRNSGWYGHGDAVFLVEVPNGILCIEVLREDLYTSPRNLDPTILARRKINRHDRRVCRAHRFRPVCIPSRLTGHLVINNPRSIMRPLRGSKRISTLRDNLSEIRPIRSHRIKRQFLRMLPS